MLRRFIVLLCVACTFACARRAKVLPDLCSDGTNIRENGQTICKHDAEDGFECPDDWFEYDAGNFIACSEEELMEETILLLEAKYGLCKNVECSYVAGEACVRGDCVVSCEQGTGAIKGVTCAPSGQALGNAAVELTGVDCDGNAFTLMTTSDAAGEYVFGAVPAGNNLNLRFEIGSFSSESKVRVNPGEELLLSDGSVCLNFEANIAVIEGTWDSIENILKRMGISYDTIGDDASEAGAAVAFLSDLNQLSAYDIIFINCGVLADSMPGVMNAQSIGNAIRSYVESGGSVYVSDWSFPFVEYAFPDAIDWLAEDEADWTTTRTGEGEKVDGRVLTNALQTTLGANTAEITLDGLYAVMSDNGPSTTVHVNAQVSGVMGETPLIVSHDDPSGGRLVYTSFHNKAQISKEIELILLYLVFLL